MFPELVHESNEIVSVTGKSNVSEVLPTGQLSNIPWRRAGVKYTNNEAYFDVIEEVAKYHFLFVEKT